MAIVELIVVVGSALCAVGVGMLLLRHTPLHATTSSNASTDSNRMSLLFEGVDLHHATPEAEMALQRQTGQTDWQALQSGLGTRFPELPGQEDLPDTGTLTLPATNQDDVAVLHLHREAEMTRVEIQDDTPVDPTTQHKLSVLQFELDTLRLAATEAPYPIWLVDDTKRICWRNSAYMSLQAAVHGTDEDAQIEVFHFTPNDVSGKTSVRAPVKMDRNGTTEWYNVTATEAGASTVFHAVDINAVIHAEVAQRNFVQTLAKTFAQLSIGLAIFDRNGQLALFNPALVDLTSLPAEFLSGRPDMLSFFDRLRDNRVMPEPKNYGSWRHEISEMINAASHGSYHETWNLNTGHTYRVSGRPHPDGAIAFLIEDITAEISLTRNFRAELELGQSLMDTFDDALVVFSSAGVLTFCNAAYREMWKLDPDNSFADVTIVDSLRAWQEKCAPDPAWGDMRDYVMKFGERAAWDVDLTHQDMGPIRAQVSPIASGATLIKFAACQHILESAVTEMT